MFGKKRTPQPSATGTATKPIVHNSMPTEGNMSLKLPTLNQSQTSDPLHPPIGGFYDTFERLNVKEPSRAFNDNLFVAHRRVAGSVSPEAMTPDVVGPYAQGGLGGYIR
jgi:hypothetical protein